MLLKWWRGVHINIRVLLILCLVCSIGYPLLDKLLWYTDDPEIVRHAAAKQVWGPCYTQLAHAQTPLSDDRQRAICECAGKRFSEGLTAAEIKPYLKHKDQSGPAFELTPALRSKVDAAVVACGAGPGT